MQIWPLQGFWLFETLSTAQTQRRRRRRGGGRIPPNTGKGGVVETGWDMFQVQNVRNRTQIPSKSSPLADGEASLLSLMRPRKQWMPGPNMGVFCGLYWCSQLWNNLRDYIGHLLGVLALRMRQALPPLSCTETELKVPQVAWICPKYDCYGLW